jgi:hypothetical protein
MTNQKEKKADSIFIQIAAYRDPQLIPTIKDLLDNADYPDNLVISVAWQHNPDDKWDDLSIFKNDQRFKIIDIDYREAKGVCWARNAVQQMYNNEKYTLQLDSHHRFVKHWDSILIDMLTKLQQDGHKKPLLTSYVPSFDPDNDPSSRVKQPWKMNFDRFIPEGAVFFLPAVFDVLDDIDKPMPARFYSAHFAFSIGDFAKEVQHDPNMYFHGEEISIAVRAFTHGYDLFHPHKIICWHEYTRKGRNKHWDDHNKWYVSNNKSHKRNRILFGMEEGNSTDLGIYGFGTNRSLLDYEKYAGICFKHRSVTRNVIDHKPPCFEKVPSDQEFYDSLMPIFKHCIDIQYQQVPLKDYDFWCVAFKDAEGVDIYRKDADPNEIRNMMNDTDGYCKIWREFQTNVKPNSWIVWPHSQSSGWCEPITGLL